MMPFQAAATIPVGISQSKAWANGAKFLASKTCYLDIYLSRYPRMNARKKVATQLLLLCFLLPSLATLSVWLAVSVVSWPAHETEKIVRQQ